MDERRLQRWLDGEMAEVEADAFLATLDESERREAMALAAVAEAAGRLPAAVPSPDFAARAMARVRTRRPPRRSVWTWLRAPALSPLTALAGAAAIAVGAFAVAGWPGRAPREPAAEVVAARASPTRIVPARNGSPEVLARLAYRAPLAREVAVAGDFNGWNAEAARMRRGEGGVWTVEIPVAPGKRYQYMFVVDGRWVTDPAAPASVEDGFGGRNAVLDL
jgi:Carbohydrate-binding module 48 (Isoamylase N-terminal domain)